MIWTPDRLSELLGQIERGEPIDTRRLAALSAIDLARAGQQFAQAAILHQEAKDNEYGQQFTTDHSR
jgi:hypothetical protein